MDITVVDVNDNSPTFIYKLNPKNGFFAEKYYAAIPVEAPISSFVLQVQAKDADSGALGQLVYEIVEESNIDHLLTMERATGTIRTDKMVNLPQLATKLPVRLVIKARDNPGQLRGYRETNSSVIVSHIFLFAK